MNLNLKEHKNTNGKERRGDIKFVPHQSINQYGWLDKNMTAV